MKTRTLLVLGANGDLANRLLLPGLRSLLDAEPDLDVRLIGAGRKDIPHADWKRALEKTLRIDDRPASDSAKARLRGVIDSSRYLQADVGDPAALRELIGACPTAPAVYFALPPAVAIAACEAMRGIELPTGTVLALEKPFGTSVATARQLNDLLATLVPEQQVYRVDHFLGKSTVLNLLGLRFANRIFEPVWNSTSVDHVEIVYDEKLGLEERAGYYDHAGALTDMIQSHLLLVLALVCIEPPAGLDAEDLRGEMAQVLRATRPYGGDPAAASRRARYTAGSIEGREFPSYADEDGIDPARGTETLAEVTVGVENWRWSGVPFTLRSGKALGDARKEIIITFKPVPHLPTGFLGCASPPRLRIILGPDCLHLDLNINGAGDPFTLEPVTLSARFAEGDMTPYGEVLDGILDGDPLLSIRGDVAEQCWRIIEPVQQAWRKGAVPLEEYPAGTPGPAGWGAR
ncbi:glucose-6-phosphate dehydrogenase [Lolliginicoccus lacisalsi]|uniref:glucose-6-phosphate dehydrogenase n=1 Tax=Lolliginicoccus lacisalsi TaxID=2742202 RepID=UPI002FD17B91